MSRRFVRLAASVAASVIVALPAAASASGTESVGTTPISIGTTRTEHVGTSSITIGATRNEAVGGAIGIQGCLRAPGGGC